MPGTRVLDEDLAAIMFYVEVFRKVSSCPVWFQSPAWPASDTALTTWNKHNGQAKYVVYCSKEQTFAMMFSIEINGDTITRLGQ